MCSSLHEDRGGFRICVGIMLHLKTRPEIRRGLGTMQRETHQQVNSAATPSATRYEKCTVPLGLSITPRHLSCRAHEQYAYCQAGTSGYLTSDNTTLIGTPGPYTWRGTVFVVSVEDNFLYRDKTLYNIAVSPDASPVDKYSYLGKKLLFISYTQIRPVLSYT